MLRSLALVPAAVVVALGLAEGLYRLVRLPALSPSSHPSYVRHDRELGWSYVPGARAQHRSTEFDVSITINQTGFRGPEWENKRPGVMRILLLGDSEAFGWGVHHGRTFGNLVDAASGEWEVLNAAVAAYGTDQQLLLLQRLVGTVEPDLVVCLFTRNDLFENTMSVAYGRPKPWFGVHDGELILHGQPVPYPLLDRVSVLSRAAKKNLWVLQHRTLSRNPDDEWRITKALYRAMRDALEGRPLVLVSDTDVLEVFAAEEPNIFHANIAPLVATAGESIRYSVDRHLNDAGHEGVARILRKRLRGILETTEEVSKP